MKPLLVCHHKIQDEKNTCSLFAAINVSSSALDDSYAVSVVLSKRLSQRVLNSVTLFYSVSDGLTKNLC